MESSLRIFVNIASYRDTECQWTVRDLFEKASNPDRVFVGLCWQFVPGEDDDCFEIETRPEQVRRIDFHAKESRGVCWARNKVQGLWEGEEFTLQIDSHMRFVEGWDDILLEMYKDCPTEKAVLTTYPIPYVPPNELSAPAIVTIMPKYFDKHGILMFRSEAKGIKQAPEKPTPTSYIAAGFLFGPGQTIADAPYDPHIYFQGEEITLACRLWTHGWDLFTPNKHIIYHDYTNRPNRIRHWKDDLDWGKLNQRSMKRVRHILDMQTSTDKHVLEDIEQYGLGTARSLLEYEAFSHLDFKKRMINGAVALEPPAPTSDDAKEHRKKVFGGIFEHNQWGDPESVSGGGSTMAQTKAIRRALPKILQELKIETLVDAACGDVNWFSGISSDLRLYLGFDIVPTLLEANRKKFKDRKNHFFADADIVADILPRGDAILCRDCLTHMTSGDSKQALRNFKKSGSTYLIATSHTMGQNTEVKSGGWYPMNLTSPPFQLPAPVRVIDEEFAGTSKTLGIWKLSDINIP